jgi:hypothetical protein
VFLSPGIHRVFLTLFPSPYLPHQMSAIASFDDIEFDPQAVTAAANAVARAKAKAKTATTVVKSAAKAKAVTKAAATKAAKAANKPKAEAVEFNVSKEEKKQKKKQLQEQKKQLKSEISAKHQKEADLLYKVAKFVSTIIKDNADKAAAAAAAAADETDETMQVNVKDMCGIEKVLLLLTECMPQLVKNAVEFETDMAMEAKKKEEAAPKMATSFMVYRSIEWDKKQHEYMESLSGPKPDWNEFCAKVGETWNALTQEAKNVYTSECDAFKQSKERTANRKATEDAEDKAEKAVKKAEKKAEKAIEKAKKAEEKKAEKKAAAKRKEQPVQIDLVDLPEFCRDDVSPPKKRAKKEASASAPVAEEPEVDSDSDESSDADSDDDDADSDDASDSDDE